MPPLKYFLTNKAGTDYVVVAKEDIASLTDLGGKTVGVEALQSLAHVLVYAAIKNKGGDPTAPNYVVIGGSGARTAALLAGSIDASGIHEYQWEVLKTQTTGLKVLSVLSDDFPLFIEDGMITTTSYMQNNPKVMSDLVKSFIRAIRALNADDGFDTWTRLLSQYELELPEQVQARPMWEFLRSHVWDANGGMEQDRLNYMIDIFHEIGLIPTRLPNETFFDTSYVNQALSELGTQ